MNDDERYKELREAAADTLALVLGPSPQSARLRAALAALHEGKAT